MINRILASLLLLFVSACSDPVKEELVNYVNQEIPPIVAMGKDFIATHTAARQRSDASDEETAQSVMIAVTKCHKYEEAVSAISQKLHTPEVRQLNEILIEAANKSCAGITSQVDAINKEDLNLLNQANAQLNEAGKIQRKWQSQLDVLAKSHNVVFNKSVTAPNGSPQSQQATSTPQASQQNATNKQALDSLLPTGSELAQSAIRLQPMKGEKSLLVEGSNVTGSCGTSVVRVLGVARVVDNFFDIDSDARIIIRVFQEDHTKDVIAPDTGAIIVPGGSTKELILNSDSGVLSDHNGVACVATTSGSRLLVWSNCAGSACGDDFSFFVIDPERLVFLAPQDPRKGQCDEKCASQLLGNQLPQKINGR